MSAFTFDTSGAVEMPVTTNIPSMSGMHILVRWSDLSPFEQGYIEALFASALPPNGGRLLIALRGASQNPFRAAGFSDLAPEALAAIRKDCAAAARAPGLYGSLHGHGALFWTERQRGMLSEDGPPFPPLTPSLGDDGKVYLREGASA